jgi:hypothetical protein
MALRHGNKAYFQILLDPHRAELVQQEAKKAGKRATAWIRDVVYEELRMNTPSEVYNDAETADQIEWRKSVRRRIEGRTKKDN